MAATNVFQGVPVQMGVCVTLRARGLLGGSHLQTPGLGYRESPCPHTGSARKGAQAARARSSWTLGEGVEVGRPLSTTLS